MKNKLIPIILSVLFLGGGGGLIGKYYTLEARQVALNKTIEDLKEENKELEVKSEKEVEKLERKNDKQDEEITEASLLNREQATLLDIIAKTLVRLNEKMDKKG